MKEILNGSNYCILFFKLVKQIGVYINKKSRDISSQMTEVIYRGLVLDLLEKIKENRVFLYKLSVIKFVCSLFLKILSISLKKLLKANDVDDKEPGNLAQVFGFFSECLLLSPFVLRLGLNVNHMHMEINVLLLTKSNFVKIKQKS